jgi:hypothetical protein
MKWYSSLSFGPIAKGRAGAVPVKITIKRMAKVVRRAKDVRRIAVFVDFTSYHNISISDIYIRAFDYID